jgi:hypothetical protein
VFYLEFLFVIFCHIFVVLLLFLFLGTRHSLKLSKFVLFLVFSYFLYFFCS